MKHAEKTNNQMKQQRKSVEAQQISEDRTLLLETICKAIPFRLEVHDWMTGNVPHTLNPLPEDTVPTASRREKTIKTKYIMN